MNWHQRYLQQSRWTSDLRAYLFEKTDLAHAGRVLEVGCGTGAVLSTLQTPSRLYGLDHNADALKTGAQNTASMRKNLACTCFTLGDAHFLPYPDQTFEIVYCHFLLLWLHDPLRALMEMKRVTKSKGHVLAIAEPDYTARIDQPDEFIGLGKLQNESLIHQGADIRLGARLADLFSQAGIKIMEAGILRSLVSKPLPAEEWQGEWAVIESDLTGFVPIQEIARLKKMNERAYKDGTRVLNVPTYFAWGQV